MIQFLIRFLDPICLIVSLRRYHPTFWIGNLDRILDRPFRKIGSLGSHDPIFGSNFGSNSSASQPPYHMPSQLPSRPARLLDQPASHPALAGLPASWLAWSMADGLATSWPKLPSGHPAGWLVGWLASLLWLPGQELQLAG